VFQGGTKLRGPLEDILGKPAIPDYPRAVFVLTDGEIDDRDATVNMVGRLARINHSRVFAMGIGSGADKSLVEGLATAGGGYGDMIPDNTPMQPVVIKQLGQALQPTLRCVKAVWTGVKGGQHYPSKCVPFSHQLFLSSTTFLSSLLCQAAQLVGR
jgi:hypothetical protein